MQLQPSPAELESVRPVERNCSKNISVVNDIYSFDKEVPAAKNAHKEGGALCSSVQIMATKATSPLLHPSAFYGFSAGSGNWFISGWLRRGKVT